MMRVPVHKGIGNIPPRTNSGGPACSRNRAIRPRWHNDVTTTRRSSPPPEGRTTPASRGNDLLDPAARI
jgi:hypothetical protein